MGQEFALARNAFVDTSKSVVDSPLEQDPLLSFASEEGSGEPVAARAGIQPIHVVTTPRVHAVGDGLRTRPLTRATGVAAVVRSHWARSQNRQSVRRLKTVRARREVSRLSVRFSKFAVGVAVGALIASSDGTSPSSRIATGAAPVDAVGTSLIGPTVVPERPPASVPATAGEPAIDAAAPASPRPSGHRGTLIVTSQPVGASVFVNNRLAGRTPLVMNALPIGSRAVRLSLDGYTPWSRGVSVVANQSITVSAKLEPGR